MDSFITNGNLTQPDRQQITEKMNTEDLFVLKTAYESAGYKSVGISLRGKKWRKKLPKSSGPVSKTQKRREDSHAKADFTWRAQVYASEHPVKEDVNVSYFAEKAGEAITGLRKNLLPLE